MRSKKMLLMLAAGLVLGLSRPIWADDRGDSDSKGDSRPGHVREKHHKGSDDDKNKGDGDSDDGDALVPPPLPLPPPPLPLPPPPLPLPLPLPLPVP
jgi:hypothetical protein